MKKVKKLPLVLLLVILSINVNAQVADSIFHERLYYSCKVWGHVKYHHTEVANGHKDIDDALLTFVSAIKTAPNNAAFNDSLLIFLSQFGPMGINTTIKPVVPDSMNNNSDMTWIQDPFFSSSVITILDTIRSKFRPQSHVLISEAWAGGIPIFDTDNKYYAGTEYPTEDKRILAIFRYWNIINYFFPYKDIMDQNWDTTLDEFIPQLMECSNALEYTLVFRMFTAKINDSHAFYYNSTLSSWKGNKYPPFQVRFIENELVITKVLAYVTEVSVGDIIKKIDGIEINHLRDSLRIYSYGSNDVIIDRNLNTLILNGEYGSFPITVFNGTNEINTTLLRNNSHSNALNVDNSPIWKDTTINGNCNYGIVDMGRLDTTHINTMIDNLWSTDAIIFDLRNYPNVTLWTLVNYLYISSIHIANFTRPDITYPGRLSWEEEYIGNGTSNPYQGKILILFDERTQSQAEYTCMGIEQFPGAIKIGSTTAASDGTVAKMYLPGNIYTYATFLGVYYPDYTATQRVGIIPDYEVLPTIQGIRDGRDEVMEFALNCNLIDINEIKANEELIKLFPNPSSDNLYYETQVVNPISIEIYNILGQKSKTINENIPSGTIDISDLEKGVYFVKIVLNNRVSTQTVIKN